MILNRLCSLRASIIFMCIFLNTSVQASNGRLSIIFIPPAVKIDFSSPYQLKHSIEQSLSVAPFTTNTFSGHAIVEIVCAKRHLVTALTTDDPFRQFYKTIFTKRNRLRSLFLEGISPARLSTESIIYKHFKTIDLSFPRTQKTRYIEIKFDDYLCSKVLGNHFTFANNNLLYGIEVPDFFSIHRSTSPWNCVSYAFSYLQLIANSTFFQDIVRQSTDEIVLDPMKLKKTNLINNLLFYARLTKEHRRWLEGDKQNQPYAYKFFNIEKILTLIDHLRSSQSPTARSSERRFTFLPFEYIKGITFDINYKGQTNE